MKLRDLSILCLFFFIQLIGRTALGQDNKGAINGMVKDSASAKPIPFATVTVFRAVDTTIVTYRLTDDKGTFKIPGLPQNLKLRVVITNMGNKVYRHEFTLPADKPTLDMGAITLGASSTALNEVLVKAERPPVVIRKDTIEFNASSFKTLPDALVEDLLRKLPGVSVDRNGNIVVNGRPVSKIFVDGKDFFGGDTRIATRNLPANVIDKVQVTNDKEALKRDPYMAEADIPQVINLKMRPEIKSGAFGKLYAGGGSQDRFEGGGIINLFRDTTQISLIGYGNNLSKAGFGYDDVYNSGGFNRSGWSSYSTTGSGGFAINDISFGGTGSGIQKSAGGGANYNTLIFKKTQLNLQYFYGRIKSDLQEQTNTQQFYNDTTLLTLRSGNQIRTTNNHNFAGRLQFNTDSATDFDFKPSFSIGNSNSDLLSLINTSSNFAPAINKSTNRQFGPGRTFSYYTTLSIYHDFKKKGRNYSIFTTVDGGSNNNDQFNTVNNIFYQTGNTSDLNQLRNNNDHNFVGRTSIRYTDPISKKLSFNTTFISEYLNNYNDIGTYNTDVNGEYTMINNSVSGKFDRQGWKNSLTTGLRWTINKFNITPSVKFNSVIIDNHFQYAPTIKQRFFNILPNLNANYKIFYLSYSVNFREPSITDLQPVPNNTNPLYVVLGNPNLKPAISNYMNLSLRKYDTQKSVTYNVTINGSINNNATIRARTVSSTGVQTIRPVNVDGVWDFGNRLSFQKDKKYSGNNQISLVTSNYVGYSRSVVMLNEKSSRYEVFRLTPGLEFRLNLNDKFEFNQSYALNYNRSTYQTDDFSGLAITYQDSRTAFVYRPHQNLVLETNLNYRYNSDVTPGIQKSYNIWNSSITYVFLKGRRGQLKFAVNDILNQNISSYRYVNGNSIEDNQTNTLKRYGLLTFTYNIRSFGEKVGGKNQLLRF